MNQISFTLCGDIFISQRLPNYDGFEAVSKLIKSHDCGIGNLETTVHKSDGYPAAFPGGGYSMASPDVLDSLKRMGIDILNTANNHAMDYGIGGLIATNKYLDEKQIIHFGTGVNLAEASMAKFVDTSNGRVAVIGITSSFHDSYAAGPQNQDMQGRPGVAPLKHKAIYGLTEEYYNQLVNIANISGINCYHSKAKVDGYLPADANFKFGSFEFVQNKENTLHTYPDANDMQRTERIVRDAARRSDMTIVSLHSHQFRNGDNRLPAEFMELFCRKCIDVGAQVIFCHGPHHIRGIERYKDGIIFHGLGNFIFQHEDMDLVPEELYCRYNMSRCTSDGIGELMDIRNDHGNRGLSINPATWQSFIPSLSYSETGIKVSLYPIELIHDSMRGLRGLPRLTKDLSVLEELQELSTAYSTKIKIDKKRGIAFV